MSTSNTATAAGSVDLKALEAETQNEIDQILNEVEALRRELSGETTSTSVPTESKSAEAPVAAAATTTAAPAKTAAAPATEPTVSFDTPAEASDEDDLMKEFRASIAEGGAADDADGGMEATLAEVSAIGDDTAGKTLLDQTFDEVVAEASRPVSQPARVPSAMETTPMSNTNSSSSSGSLTITLSGGNTLNLNYEFEVREVTVSFADQTLRVTLTDGTELKLPMSSVQGEKSHGLKRVA